MNPQAEASSSSSSIMIIISSSNYNTFHCCQVTSQPMQGTNSLSAWTAPQQSSCASTAVMPIWDVMICERVRHLMTDPQAADTEKFRLAYEQLPIVVSSVALTFQIAPDCSTVVRSSLRFALRTGCSIPSGGLLLNGGSDVEFVSLAINGGTPSTQSYAVSRDGLQLSRCSSSPIALNGP